MCSHGYNSLNSTRKSLLFSVFFFRWRIGKWGKCHACAFQSGVRMRRVECVKESPHPGGEENLVDDKECNGPRPASRELCNAVKVCRCRRKTTLGIPNRQLRDVWKKIRKVELVSGSFICTSYRKNRSIG